MKKCNERHFSNLIVQLIKFNLVKIKSKDFYTKFTNTIISILTHLRSKLFEAYI